MGEACSTNGRLRNKHKILVEKPEGEIKFGDLGAHGGIIFKFEGVK
jgi:hypothetical protein